MQPYMRAYTQYAYIDMIINNEVRTGEEIVRFSLSEDIRDEWTYDLGDAKIIFNEDSISLNEHHLVKNKVKHFYRKLKSKDELVLCIKNQQYTNEWDSIGFFIDSTLENLDEYPKMIYTLGSYASQNLHQLYQGRFSLVTTKYDTKEYPIYLKLKINGDVIESYYGYDGEEWILVERIENAINLNEEHYVGLYVSILDRHYYKWVYNNFIQLVLDLNDETALNYAGFVRRDFKNYLINPFLRISNEKASVIESYGLDLWSFLKVNIDNNRYVEMYLNEKYIPGMETYQLSDKIHENLIYGYDDEKQELLLISIYEGKPCKYSVKLQDFMKAYNEAKGWLARRFYIFEYKPNNRPYEFDVAGIVRQLKEYLNGTDSSLMYTGIMCCESGVYGINIYDGILANDASKFRFATDYRLAYTLSEHKQCMRDRVEYLIVKGYLKEEDTKEILESLDLICSKARRILSTTLKVMMRKDYTKCESAWNLLREIRDAEITTYQNIINLLEKYLSRTV